MTADREHLSVGRYLDIKNILGCRKGEAEEAGSNRSSRGEALQPDVQSLDGVHEAREEEEIQPRHEGCCLPQEVHHKNSTGIFPHD